MRRRLTLAIVGAVAGALVLAGVGTLALARRSAREQARRELVTLVQQVASEPAVAQRPVLRKLLNLDGFARLNFGPGGRTVNAPPAGLTVADLDPPNLLAGRVVSGSRGATAYAAVVVARSERGASAAVVVTRRLPGIRQAAGWFVIAAAIALLAAVALAEYLGRRILRPLREAEEATRRIAGGDLRANVPIPHESYPELRSLAVSINSMADSLSRAKGLERQFLMSVSHDLRTPLTSIRGFAEAIAEGAATDTPRAAAIIAAESRRLERLVQDLLDLAKLDARRFSLDLRRVDAREVVADTAEGFRPAADKEGVRITLAGLDGEAIDVAADPERLAQVVANVMENALKFADSVITVELSPSANGAVVLAVTDDGPGIPGADLPHIFERLYQSSRRPARQVGSGLGLAIVAELVAAMGGRVEATSPVGSGTTVSVSVKSWSSGVESWTSSSTSKS